MPEIISIKATSDHIKVTMQNGNIYNLPCTTDPEAQMITLAEWAMNYGYTHALRVVVDKCGDKANGN